MNRPVQTETFPDLSELIQEIESVTEGAHWRLATGQVFAILDARIEDYVRFLYERREGEVPDETFHEGNAGQLVDFLSAQGYPQAPVHFQKAGLFFLPAFLLDWLEFFQSVTISRLLSRDVDRDLLETAVAGCREFADAAEFYCRALFEPEELKGFAVRAYLERHGVPDTDLSRGQLLSFLEAQFRLRVLRWEDLEEAVYDALYERARRWGLISGARQTRLDSLSPRVLDALRELEFRGPSLPEPAQLRKRYRLLLRRHHPDVNANGLERTRTLIEAYALVVRATQNGNGAA